MTGGLYLYLLYILLIVRLNRGKILELLKAHPEYSAKKMANAIGISEKAIEKLYRCLTKSEIGLYCEGELVDEDLLESGYVVLLIEDEHGFLEDVFLTIDEAAAVLEGFADLVLVIRWIVVSAGDTNATFADAFVDIQFLGEQRVKFLNFVRNSKKLTSVFIILTSLIKQNKPLIISDL